ncbi:TetR family transcriptional regulator [Pseudarthrobacter sp. Fe7]|nr:TetR family transcriptional regulator [Pseudarthrobacter sp. Fe7]
MRRLAERARLSIQNSGLVQREVARHVGLDETKLSKSLAGTRRFRPSELTSLADVTGVTVNWLMSGSDQTLGVSVPPSAMILPTKHAENSDHARKRRTIVESAWWLLARRGYSAVRIVDIASACGVSTATVHYYFATKREIFAEVLRYSVKLAFDRQIAEPACHQGARESAQAADRASAACRGPGPGGMVYLAADLVLRCRG